MRSWVDINLQQRNLQKVRQNLFAFSSLPSLDSQAVDPKGLGPRGLETPGARDPMVLGLEGAWDPGQFLTHNV